MRQNAVGRWRVAGVIRFLVNARDLQLECARVLYETLLVLVKYGSETMLWKERSRVRGLLGIRRMDRILNAWIRELCGVRKGLDERINEGILQWFGHVERMEGDRITKKVYVGECAGIRSLGKPQKRWIDTVKERLRKRGLDVRQARRMVQERSEWQGFVRGNAWSVAQGMNH